jgi:acyl carrier protein
MNAMIHRSAQEVEKWLVSYIARQLGAQPEQISLNEEFVNLGLSSRQAVELTLELEEFVGRPTDAGLVYDYPTIRSLAKFLTTQPAAAKA